MSPEISVIIAAYNVEAYIGRAIHSALSQAGVSVEVIVVDDCSSDETAEVVAAIEDQRVTFLRLATNGGPGAARNAGIKAAKGSWIAVLDSDDLLMPGRLARCLARAAATKADIVVDNPLVKRESDNTSFPMFVAEKFSSHPLLDLPTFIANNRSFFLGYTFGYLKPIVATKFLRVHDISYDPDVRIGEDYLFLADMLAVGGVCMIEPQPGYVYTVRAGSISHRTTPVDLERIAASDRKFVSRHTLSPAARKAQKRRDAGVRDALAFALLVDGIKQKNPRTAFKALRLSPLTARHLWEAIWLRIAKPRSKMTIPDESL